MKREAPVVHSTRKDGGKSRILCVLAEGPLRCSELRGEMTDISDPALAKCQHCDYRG